MSRSRFLRSPPAKVDAYSRKLLSLLSSEGRASTVALGKQLRLSREVVAYRMKRLEEQGIIQGYTVIPRFKKLSVREYRICLLLDEKSKAQHTALIEHMASHPNTVSVVQYSDTWDIRWSMICRDIDEFDGIVRHATTLFPNVIIGFEKHAVITTYASHMLPAVQRPHNPARMAKDTQLDETDRNVLAALGKHGRESSYVIAAMLGVSSDTVLAHMRSLTDRELVGGYTPVINLGALGYLWYTYVIQFSHLNEQEEQMLTEYVSRHPRILRAVKTFGQWDVMFEIVVENAEQYHETAKEIKNTFAAIIRRYEAWNVYQENCYCAVPAKLTSLASQAGTTQRTSSPRQKQGPSPVRRQELRQ